ncbi:biopolymer transporter Tol [bacterium]|nr:biopolymer transporter Tol [bacterium]
MLSISLSRLSALLLSALLLPGVLTAQEATITVKKSDTISIAIKPFSGSDAAIASKVVANDLDLSGLFSVGIPERANFSVGGSSGGGSLQGVVTDNRGGVLLQKTYSGVETLTGQHGIAASKFAFVSNRTGAKEIYISDYDGANQRQITQEKAISVAPAISPDASRIAYTGYQSGYADIYLIDLHSGARSPIMKFPGTNSGASFSPDGSRIACTLSRDGNPELYIAAANGSGARRLTRSRGVESSPSWSPDGVEIVYSSDDTGGPQLYRISTAGGAPRRISTGFNYCTEPSWSPDGKKIAFTVRQGGFSIAIVDLATGATRVLDQGQDPCWGADSRHIIYSDGSTIMLMDTIKGRKTPVASGLGKVSEPSWSR